MSIWLKEKANSLTSFVPFSCKLFLCQHGLQTEIHPVFCTGLHRLPNNPSAMEKEQKQTKFKQISHEQNARHQQSLKRQKIG